MGRPFKNELCKCEETVHLANTVPIDGLARELSGHLTTPTIFIGAGGSLTCAEFGRLLFESLGSYARVSTPLDFITSAVNCRGLSVVILSASGNNKDIVHALRVAIEREAKKITVISTSKRSKLAAMARLVSRARVLEYPLHCGRDGYLATNSILTTCSVMARALTGLKLDPSCVSSCIQAGVKGFSQMLAQREFNHCTIVFEGWTSPAAIDLESKLSEAGLLSSMLCDYRQFAHGRHNWMDKQRGNTSIVALSTPRGKKLTLRTLSHLPGDIPRWHFLASDGGLCSALEATLAVFGFIAGAGEHLGIDPGRPNVPSYGSKIYHLGPIGFVQIGRTAAKRLADLGSAVVRKVSALRLDDEVKQQYVEGAHTYLSKMRSQTYGALVVDYDGTTSQVGDRDAGVAPELVGKLIELLESGVAVFFATGRGDSIHKPLKAAFPTKTWRRIHIGYYNGSFCLPLSRSDRFEASLPRHSRLRTVERRIRSHPLISENCEIENKHCQITLKVRSGVSSESLSGILAEIILGQSRLGVKFFTSSHSIDILPRQTSKMVCIRSAKAMLSSKAGVLAIGDCGAFPGNDFELLQTEYSLSVDSVSTNISSCWNFLPIGVSHTDGTAEYFRRIEVMKESFSLKI